MNEEIALQSRIRKKDLFPYSDELRNTCAMSKKEKGNKIFFSDRMNEEIALQNSNKKKGNKSF